MKQVQNNFSSLAGYRFSLVHQKSRNNKLVFILGIYTLIIQKFISIPLEVMCGL